MYLCLSLKSLFFLSVGDHFTFIACPAVNNFGFPTSSRYVSHLKLQEKLAVTVRPEPLTFFFFLIYLSFFNSVISPNSYFLNLALNN